MSDDFSRIQRFEKHENAFGFMRLLLASLVIVSHAPELIDGNRSREILTQIFGTMSFGEVAVDGFFIVSGYLIFGSFLKNQSVLQFLAKRIMRIYPAFIVASLVCLIIVAPLAGANFADLLSSAFHSLQKILVLSRPRIDHVFSGTPYPDLNGAMWTISWEFRCYILVMILGIFGILKKPLVILIGAFGCLALNEVREFYGYGHSPLLRFAGVYLSGGLFYLWREKLDYTPVRACVAALALFALMFAKWTAEPAFVLFGGYIIFSVASLARRSILARINNKTDISYGVYLYAWPIEKLIIWYWPGVSPLVAGLLTFLAAILCGWLSWHGIEKHAIRFVEKLRWPSEWENFIREYCVKNYPFLVRKNKAFQEGS